MAELAGKFKWGMSPTTPSRSSAPSVHEKYAELIKTEQEVYKQDNLRKQEHDEIDKVKASLVNSTDRSPAGSRRSSSESSCIKTAKR